jgi:hypothetical protein
MVIALLGFTLSSLACGLRRCLKPCWLRVAECALRRSDVKAITPTWQLVEDHSGSVSLYLRLGKVHP